MPKSPFCLFSTAGNTTLFVSAPDAALPALDIIPCEQAASVDIENGIVRMSADEFCVNACLAFACLRKLAGKETGQLRMLDIPVQLGANGECPHWLAKACMPFGQCVIENIDNIQIVHLPGISHALVRVDELPGPDTARIVGEKLLTDLHLRHKPAAGIIWHVRKGGSRYAILPLVSAPRAGTCNLEHACGSGSIALARILGQGSYEIEQPSGATINVCNAGENMEIEASVHLLAQGELWLA